MGGVEDAEQRFAVLFGRHYDRVRRYALRRADLDWADDVAAEVFAAAWRRIDDVPDQSLPWLIGTARRVLANQRRSRQRANRLHLRIRAERPEQSYEMEDARELRQRWAAALQALSSADQEVLALIAWDGLTAEESAASLGCSIPAFTMRLHRARRRLASHLDLTNPKPEPRLRAGEKKTDGVRP